MVHPTGIEPILLVPETNVLSVELRVQTKNGRAGWNRTIIVSLEGICPIR